MIHASDVCRRVTMHLTDESKHIRKRVATARLSLILLTPKPVLICVFLSHITTSSPF